MTGWIQNGFSAIILCAGVGRRLDAENPRPKAMLRFGARTLIERHLAALSALGCREVVIVTGFMADALQAHIGTLAIGIRVSYVFNRRFREGSVVSLSVAADLLRGGDTILLMDGDVLCDTRMFEHLLAGAPENVLLFDPEIEPGDEPVKICLDASAAIVDFRKRPEHPYVTHGESVGFFRFSSTMAAALADGAIRYAAGAGSALEYEEVIRDMILIDRDRFGIVDIGGLPWTEIDFPDDVVRARDVILPLLEDK